MIERNNTNKNVEDGHIGDNPSDHDADRMRVRGDKGGGSGGNRGQKMWGFMYVKMPILLWGKTRRKGKLSTVHAGYPQKSGTYPHIGDRHRPDYLAGLEE